MIRAGIFHGVENPEPTRGRGRGLLVEDAFDGKVGGEAFAHFGFDAVLEGHHGVGTGMAGAVQAQIDGVAVHGHKLHVAAVTLDEGADFLDIGFDFFLHGRSPLKSNVAGT